MKYDLEYIKNILNICENYEEHADISTSYLLDKLKIQDNKEQEKFVYHMRLLKDDDLIDSDADNLGFPRDSSNRLVIFPVNIRLTSKGHKILDVLNDSIIMNTIKQKLFWGIKEVSKVGFVTLVQAIINQCTS